jgi:hypothetical protein
MSPFRTLPSSSAATSRTFALDLGLGDVFQVSGDEKLSLDFNQRATSLTQEVMELFL